MHFTCRRDLIRVQIQHIPVGNATHTNSSRGGGEVAVGSVLGAEDPGTALAQHGSTARIPGTCVQFSHLTVKEKVAMIMSFILFVIFIEEGKQFKKDTNVENNSPVTTRAVFSSTPNARMAPRVTSALSTKS